MPSLIMMTQKTRGRCRIGALLIMAAAGLQAAPFTGDAAADNGQWAEHVSAQVPAGEARQYTAMPPLSTIKDDFQKGVVIAEAELGQMRAGFNIGGLDMDFGARLQTRIDNSIELVSVVNFTQAGVDIVSQTFRDPSRSASLVGPGTGLSVTDMTPGGVDLSGLAGFSGVALNDAKGFTAALQNITRDAILSGVVSNAAGRQIQQRIDVDVRLNNVGALRAAKQRAAIVESFSGILR